MHGNDHTTPRRGRRGAPLTRREIREARLAEELLRVAEAAAIAETPAVEPEPQPLVSRRERRLREQAESVFPGADGPPPIADPAPVAEVLPLAATTGLFRFDVGTIPLAPHSATAVALAAPAAPFRLNEDLASIEKVASWSFGRILRHSFSATLAAASVAGLILTATLPAMAPMTVGDSTQASAIQRLSVGNAANSELSADFVEGVDIAEVEAESALLSADTYANNPNGLVQYPFSRGVPLTDGFGYRTAPVAQFHDAQDFAAGDGAAIRSIADGVVTESGETTDGCGTGVMVAHKIDGLDVTSRYCHMQFGSAEVSVGDQVRVGQMVGRVGATGMAFGAHLHLALKVNGEPRDPMPFIAKYNAISR